MRQRRGYVLLATLWVIVSLSALALTGLLVARDATTGAENRIAILRGKWRAEDCLERARAVIDDALAGGQAIPRPVAGGWDLLDHVVLASPAVTEAQCDLTIVPAGLAVDVNAADTAQLLALFRVLQIPEPESDSMVAALLDWRDADDIPRPLGAESEWYRANGRFVPRNGPLANVEELRRVRGFDENTIPDSVLHAVFTVEPGRIIWNRAPLAVLASVPGVSEEALARVAQIRATGGTLASANDVHAALSPGARQMMDAQWSEIQQLTTDRPDAWIVTARGGPATIEVRLAPAGTRAAIVRRRTTP